MSPIHRDIAHTKPVTYADIEDEVPDIQPLRGVAFIRLDVPSEEAGKTAGGILLPESMVKDQKPPATGIVCAVGAPMVVEGSGPRAGLEIHPEYKVADRVVFPDYVGKKLEAKLGNADYILIDQKEIMGVIVETDNRIES